MSDRNDREITGLPVALDFDGADRIPLFDAETGNPQALTPATLNAAILRIVREENAAHPAESGITRAVARSLIAPFARADFAPPAGDNALGNIGGGPLQFAPLDNDQISDDAITGAKVREDTLTTRELADAVVDRLLPDPAAQADDRILKVENGAWVFGDQTGGGGTGEGQTAAQVEALIGGRVKPGMLNGGAVVAGELAAGASARQALRAVGGDNLGLDWGNAVSWGGSLPNAIREGEVFFAGEQINIGTVIAAATAQTFRLTPETNPVAGDDDVGFLQDEGNDAFGSVDEAGVEAWLWGLYWSDGDQMLTCVINSDTDPGNITANITGAGVFALTGSREIDTNLWQTKAASQAATFGQARDVSLTATNAITYWRPVVAAAPPAPTAAEVSVNSDFFTGNLQFEDNTVQAVAARVDGLTLGESRGSVIGLIDQRIPVNRRIPAGGATGEALVKKSAANYDTEWSAISGGGGGGGLDQSAVDGRVRALVEDWAETNNTARLPEDKMSSETAEIVGYLDEGGWADQDAVSIAQTTWAAQPTASQLTGAAYQSTFTASGGALSNRWVGIRVAAAQADETLRAAVTALVHVIQTYERHDAADWTEITTTGGNTYYAVQFAHIGFDEQVRAQSHTARRWKPGLISRAAADVSVSAGDFDGNLSATDTSVQAALETLDALTVSGADGYTAANALPTDADFDDRVRLLQPDDVPEYGILHAADSTDARGWFTNLGSANPAQDSVEGIFWAKGTYGSGGATILRNNLVFVRASSETRTPTHFYLKANSEAEVEYTAATAGVGLDHFYIARRGGARVPADPFTANAEYGYRVRWNTGADTFGTVRKEPGLYIFDGFNWDSANSASDSDRLHFAGAFEKLEDSVHGLHVPGANAARRTTLQALDTPYRIGADDSGVLFVSVQWDITNTATLQLGDETRSTTQVFISELRESTADDGNATSPHQGILCGTVDVESSAGVKQGEASLYLSRDAQQDVGLWVLYSPEAAGAAGNNGSIQARVEISRFLSDTPTIKPTITREAVAGDVEIFSTRDGTSGGVQLVGYTDSAATDATAITNWVNLYTHTAITAETNTHEDDLTCRTGWIPRGGGDRAKIEYRGILLPQGRTVPTADDVLWVHDAYVRNLNNDYRTTPNSFASQSLAQQVSKTVSIPAGGRYIVQARWAIQVAAAAGSVGTRGSNTLADFKIVWPASEQRHAVVAY